MSMINVKTFGFDIALQILKSGGTVTRKAFNPNVKMGEPLNIVVKAQYPDENSKMTEPYIYMEKKVKVKEGEDDAVFREFIKVFPLDMSVESIFGEDWVEVKKYK